MGDAVRHNACFSAAGAGQYQQRSMNMLGGLPLAVIQSIE
jgi:hypothetical protein